MHTLVAIEQYFPIRVLGCVMHVPMLGTPI